jgi:hypothetical protein
MTSYACEICGTVWYSGEPFSSEKIRENGYCKGCFTDLHDRVIAYWPTKGQQRVWSRAMPDPRGFVWRWQFFAYHDCSDCAGHGYVLKLLDESVHQCRICEVRSSLEPDFQARLAYVQNLRSTLKGLDHRLAHLSSDLRYHYKDIFIEAMYATADILWPLPKRIDLPYPHPTVVEWKEQTKRR